MDFQVSEEDIEEMFTFADKDCDGKISYTEFQFMINPPKPPPEPQPLILKAPAVKRVNIQTIELETESCETVTIKTTEPDTDSCKIVSIKTTEPKTESAKRVTIQTTEPESKSVLIFANTEADLQAEEPEKAAT